MKALSITILLSLAIALNFNFAAVTSYHRAVSKYDATVVVGYQSAKTKVQLWWKILQKQLTGRLGLLALKAVSLWHAQGSCVPVQP